MLDISITVLLKFVTLVLTTVTLVLTLLNVPLIVQTPEPPSQIVYVKPVISIPAMTKPPVNNVTINVLPVVLALLTIV